MSDKCLRSTQDKTIVLAYPWAPACENCFVDHASVNSLVYSQLLYAVDSNTTVFQFAPVYLEGDKISYPGNYIIVSPTSSLESLPPEGLDGFEEIPYEELGIKVVGLPILYPEPESPVKSRSASTLSLSEMIERTRERFGLK